MICGRGAKPSSLVTTGTIRFRDLVQSCRFHYVAAPKHKKAAFAESIYKEVKATVPEGRFLKQEHPGGEWVELSRDDSINKIRQALREGAPEIKASLTNKLPGHICSESDDVKQKGTKVSDQSIVQKITILIRIFTADLFLIDIFITFHIAALLPSYSKQG